MEESKTQETSTEEQKEAHGNEQQDPQATVLLGAISYTDESNYEKFLDSMDVNKALFVLQSAANFAQAKGAYSIAESELISRANRAIRKALTPPEGTEGVEEMVSETAESTDTEQPDTNE